MVFFMGQLLQGWQVRDGVTGGKEGQKVGRQELGHLAKSGSRSKTAVGEAGRGERKALSFLDSQEKRETGLRGIDPMSRGKGADPNEKASSRGGLCEGGARPVRETKMEKGFLSKV